MTAQRFNPLTNAENLKNLGMEDKIANEIAQQQAELINNELVTKDFLKAVLAETELRMYKVIFGMFVAFGFIQHFIK